MTSREIVRRCIEFDAPPRIGLHFATDPLDGRIWDHTDFAFVCYSVDPRFSRKAGESEWYTEWGVKRRAITTPIGEAVEHPLGGGWDSFERYVFPDFDHPSRYAGMKEQADRAHAAGKYVYGSIPSLMLLPIDLRGMQNWFLDHALEQENLGLLLDRIVSIRERIIDEYANAGIDGAITWDDMGTNDRVLVSPGTFRSLYFPRYRKTIDSLHERGMHFIHHCCGQVREYMDLFVEAECDVLQLDQPELMGIEWLGKRYGGKICFWNCVDIQRTIGRDDLDAVEDEAHRQVWFLGQTDGGFMVKAYQQPESVGMTVEEAQSQYEAFSRYARYPLVPYSTNAR